AELLGHHGQVAIACQEAERDAALGQHAANWKAEASVEVNVEHGSVQGCFTSVDQAGFEAGGRSDRLHAAFNDEIAYHFGKQVVVLDNKDARARKHAMPSYRTALYTARDKIRTRYGNKRCLRARWIDSALVDHAAVSTRVPSRTTPSYPLSAT